MLQDLLAHEEQAPDVADEPAAGPLNALRPLFVPPIPNVEKSFWISALPHSGQTTSFSPPIRTSASKWRQHPLHTNSYIGISGYYLNPAALSCPD